ncbi:MAG: hypothetical protein EBT33_22470 [Betaproteobacteria bacterium]|nr:hypothetical protein [Betaproteobacteria bacterium]
MPDAPTRQGHPPGLPARVRVQVRRPANHYQIDARRRTPKLSLAFRFHRRDMIPGIRRCALIP